MFSSKYLAKRLPQLSRVIRAEHRILSIPTQRLPLNSSCRAQFSTSPSYSFIPSTSQLASDQSKMAAQNSNQNFRLENLFKVKGKGM